MTPSGTLTAKNKSACCRLYYKNISRPVNLTSLSQLYSKLNFPAILGGNPSVSRFSYWAAEPKEIFEFSSDDKKPFDKLSKILNKYKLNENSENDLPKGIFCGGWIGYFAYELGRYIEKIPANSIDDLKTPLIRLCFYDKVLCFDHTEKTFWLIALQLPEDTKGPDEKLENLEQQLAESKKIFVASPVAANIETIDFSQVRSNMCQLYYRRAVEKIKRYIYDGDVYQVNFSQRFECDYTAKPIDLFHWQNQYNPSPYAAYIDAGSFQIVSASPEMFVTIDDRTIRTKPIKGTRPRTSDENLNQKYFAELTNSVKEQAELNMIIDLERNDMARICVPGTRTVSQPRTIETYPTVFHAVATVAGRLRDDITFCDILKAMFPGGSITGAPKVSSMKIIDETEPTSRGVYTGSIGFLGLDGTSSLNIAIRTIIIANQKAYAQTGGGIVADSDADAEWNETLTKARALLAGIKAVQGS
jgi:para-aminobenzoate synthetase component 1